METKQKILDYLNKEIKQREDELSKYDRTNATSNEWIEIDKLDEQWETLTNVRDWVKGNL